MEAVGRAGGALSCAGRARQAPHWAIMDNPNDLPLPVPARPRRTGAPQRGGGDAAAFPRTVVHFPVVVTQVTEQRGARTQVLKRYDIKGCPDTRFGAKARGGAGGGAATLKDGDVPVVDGAPAFPQVRRVGGGAPCSARRRSPSACARVRGAACPISTG